MIRYLFFKGVLGDLAVRGDVRGELLHQRAVGQVGERPRPRLHRHHGAPRLHHPLPRSHHLLRQQGQYCYYLRLI